MVLGNVFVKNDGLSVAALVDTGHEVTFKRDESCGIQEHDSSSTSAESVERAR